MKFSTQEDINAPIEAVFNMLCAFDVFERAAMQRGAEVQRLDDMAKPGVGMRWDVRFLMRGKLREIDLIMSRFDPSEEMTIDMTSQGMTGQITFELIALSRKRTRMIVGFELRPQTLPARLLVQSLKLTKTSLTEKYKSRVSEYVEEMEALYEKSV